MARDSKSPAVAKPEKPPPPPPSRWQVSLGSRHIEVTAVFAAVSTHGALTFKDGTNQLVKGFAFGEWSTVEMVDDPFGNTLVADRAARTAQPA